ncbi:MAG: DUF2442 domain-containing protein [Armatimonadetes bacterium]|nr:DUF2442 domain-containing protein [Armatimonadota bacterium]
MNISVPDPPRADAVETTDDTLVVHLTDGRTLSVPLDWFPRLRQASAEERRNWRLVGRGIGIHWDGIDEDLSVKALLQPRGMHQESA